MLLQLFWKPAGLPEPVEVNGIKQVPMAGTSMVYSFNDANAPDQHTHNTSKCSGIEPCIRMAGWLRTIHRAPWEMKPRRPLAEDIWEL
ncbi:MAG: hypothetical protein R2764_03970 [Bacteroidales bacterium]